MQLKGQEGRELEKEIEKYVKRLVLESKLNNQAGTLSGGYQRKLSVAIALIGKSKVCIKTHFYNKFFENTHIFVVSRVDRIRSLYFGYEL